MVNLMTRDQALEALKPYDGLEVRSFAPNSSYGFQKQNKGYAYCFGDKKDTLPVTPEAWNYVYSASGLPGNVINKLPEDIHTEHIVPIVDYKFRSAEQDMQALIRDQEIIGFAKGSVMVHNPRDLMMQMEKAIGGKKAVKGYEVYGSTDRQYISLLGHDERRIGKTYDRKGKFVGAIMGYGVSTYVSPYGLSVPGGNQPLEINGYNYTLACMNGAVSMQNVAHYTKRDFEQEFPEWFPGKVLEVYNAAELEYDRIKAMQEVKLPEHTAERMDSMLEQFSVPPVIRGAVAARIIDFPVENLLGLWNHVTYVASNYAAVREDPSLVRRLLSAAGSMVRNQHICDTCHQVIKPRKRVNREIVELMDEDRQN
jgi:hypothetical protein